VQGNCDADAEDTSDWICTSCKTLQPVLCIDANLPSGWETNKKLTVLIQLLAAKPVNQLLLLSSSQKSKNAEQVHLEQER